MMGMMIQLKLEGMSKKLIYIFVLLLLSTTGLAQDDDYVFDSKAVREVPPSQRILNRPRLVDTIIPIPNITYPRLARKANTSIITPTIKAANLKIVDKLDKLYRGYLRAGIGNYATPLGEIYFNTLRNRNMSMGVHLNHISSFGEIKNYAPSTYDYTTGHLFGNFYLGRYKIESGIDYLNHGYHFYGVQDTLDIFPKDTLANRVQGIGFNFAFSNTPTKDSGKVLYRIKTAYQYFHEFQPSWDSTSLHARNSNFMIGTELRYKLDKNVFGLDFDIKNNNYWFGETDPNLLEEYQRDDHNTVIHLRPTISSYGKKWKALVGIDLNWDFPSPELWKVVPVIEGKYSLFDDMFIPYLGINGGVQQNLLLFK